MRPWNTAEKIQSVRAEYEKKLQQRQSATVAFTKEFPERVIMLSQTLQTPTLEISGIT